MDSRALSFFFMPLFLYAVISPNTYPSYATILSYRDHCDSMVPTIKRINEPKFKAFPHGQFQNGYYLGGGSIYPRKERQKQVTLRIKHVYETDVAGILQVEAWLIIRSGTWYYHAHDGNFTDENFWNYNRFPSVATFMLGGLWSESSGKLCMVGIEADDSPQLQHLRVVLKLHSVFNTRSTISTLITGSLESMSSENEVSYFEPTSLFLFPTTGYEFTLDTKKQKYELAEKGELVVPGFPVNPIRFCSNLSPMIGGIYDLQYQSECTSSKNCSPIGGDPNQLPYVVSLMALVCSDEKQRVKVVVGFGNYDSGYRWSFNPNSTLVGEGWWDEEKNQLSIVGCHFLGIKESMASVHVGDCSIRISLRFPKIWSINDANSIVGQIWSNKTVGNSGYFKRINFRSHQDKRDRVSCIKYEYRKLDQVRQLCPRQETVKNEGINYPDVYSSDMRIEMAVQYYDKLVAWGYCDPFVVNDQIQNLNANENFVTKLPFISANSSSRAGLYNISYLIRLTLEPDAQIGEEKYLFNAKKNATEIEINVSAEGIYDAEAGSLCMVGCRNLGSQNQIPTKDSVDCEIVVKFQFQQIKAQNGGAYITGSIESTRKNSDPLYFNPLDLTSIAYYS